MGERKIELLNNADSQVSTLNSQQNEDANLDPLEWVEQYLDKNRIFYDYKTSSFILDGSVVELEMIVSQIRLALYKDEKLHLKNFVQDALRLLRKRKDSTYLKEVKDKLSHNPKYSSQFELLIKAITGNVDELDLCVVRHWMWLVKRKLWGFPTENELMVVLYGMSGSGKSFFLRKLLQPIDELTIYTDMRIFNDKFGLRQFTRNRVMVFDELDMVTEVSVEKLKNVITADQISWRMLRSEAVMSGRQNCTFIATTNLPVNEQIIDPTSCRRYWQLDTLPKILWDEINKIDYLSLWKSIDEHGQSPMTHNLVAVSQRQHETVLSKDSLDLWIEDCIIQHPVHEASPQSSQVYEWYENYCKINLLTDYPSFHQFTRQLCSKLKSKGFNGNFKHHHHNGTVWAIKMK